MSLRLRIEHGQDAGKTYRFAGPGVYSLGRDPSNSVRVLDMKVSKVHCEIRVAAAGDSLRAVLHDPGSTHGCELNGQPVAKGKNVRMNPGDELRLGLTILRLLSAGDSDEDAKPVAGRTVEGGGDGGSSKEAENTATLPPDELVGKKLGGYLVEKKIGAGGMGGVYLAEQVSLNRKVALKVLNETFAADSAFVDQFVNEARAAGALNHPNVVQVYDVGSDQGRYFFSMEVMPGGSIEEKIREGQIPWEDGLNYFIDAANALIFANKREILHRDVKPDNLMISEDDSAKLCDLGLAKKSEVSDLMDQGIIGTPHFISPEAIRRKPDIDHRTDLYSLGCTFYRIFTSKNPYPAGTVKEILLGHLNKPVPRIGALNRDVPKEIDDIVSRLMAKEPDERIQTPDELLRELDKIRTKYNLEAHGIKPASRKPLIIGGAAAAIAIGIAIFFAMKDPGQAGPSKFTPEQLAQMAKAKRSKAENPLRDYVAAAKAKVLELEGKRIPGNLGPDNYKKSMWTRLAKDYRDNAKTWEAKAAEWKGLKAKESDAVIKGFYDTYGGQLTEQVSKARRIAKDEIEAKIQDIKDSETARTGARTEALADADKQIGDYAAKLAALKNKRDYSAWMDAEKIIESSELDDIVKALLEREFKGFQLLKMKEDILPLLDKHIPATKKDAKRGIEIIDEGVGAVVRRKNELLKKVQKLIGGTPGHAQYGEAIKACKDFLDTLPAGFEARQDEAPRTVIELKKAKDVVEKMLERAQTNYLAFQALEYKGDRDAYFAFIRGLWNPEVGKLARFDFAGARQLVKETEAKLQVGSYKQLAQQWPPLIDALETVFKNIVAGEKNGWVDDDFMGWDRKGKPKKMRIRGISDEGVKWEKDTVPFSRSTPRWLLEQLFFFEGKPRLSSCSPVDHAGLGLLAELAGRYDMAAKQYQAGAMAEGDLGAAVRSRLTQLAKEEEAATKLLAAIKYVDEAEDWKASWDEIVAELEKDPDAISDEEKGRLVEERRAKESQHALAQDNVDTLRGRADLARTMWGSCMRTERHPDAAYAGEVLPKMPEKGPRKDGAGPEKDGGKKDAPKKGDGAKDEGAKDEGAKDEGDKGTNGGGAGK